MTNNQRLICYICLAILTPLNIWLITYQNSTQCKYSGKQGELTSKVVFQATTSTLTVYPVTDKTTFTAYTLSVEETDQSPCIGSNNNNLCELRKEMNICASRDLPLDTLIYIQGYGECVIKDRLNIRYKGSNRVDILMDNKEEALKFGVRKLNYVIVK